MNIIMYTTHCPRCKVLAAKLTTVPMLSVDGALMDFKTANDWINKQE